MFDIERHEDEGDDEPVGRSILGLGRDARPAPRSAAPAARGDEEPVGRSILGLGRDVDPAPLSPAALAAREGGEEEPVGRSILGLPHDVRPAPHPAVSAGETGATDSDPVDVPRFDVEVERKPERAFPIERAILLSLAAHVLLLLLLLFAPLPVANDPRKGLLAAFVPPEKSAEEKIPIIFKEAPGPARSNPRRSDLSDADRRAGGGDPSRGRSISPFVPERGGISGFQPGPRKSAPPAPRVAPPPAGGAGQSPGPAPEAGKTAANALELPRADQEAPAASAAGRSTGQLADLGQAIRDAAKGVRAQGEEGAGFPNPGGGFVDSGPLSFDTTWYDWGPYAAEMVRRIKLHWDVPSLARLGWKGRVTVRFFILADGRVEGATILSRSGVPPFDFAAFQAILTSNPFRPLPKDLLAEVPGKDREGVTVTFFYNIRPGDSEGSGGKR